MDGLIHGTLGLASEQQLSPYEEAMHYAVLPQHQERHASRRDDRLVER